MRLPFKQVDVFTSRAFSGNPVAVILDADEVSAEDMQRIARWTNLSETTFVLRPSTADANYRVRIFTPHGELPFAGHPTLGTAHAVLEARGAAPSVASLTQECAAGLLPLRIVTADGTRRLFVRVPPPHVTKIDAASAATLARVLGVAAASYGEPAAVDVGPIWLVMELGDREALAAMAPDMDALAVLSRDLGATGATVFTRDATGDVAVAVRSFAPAYGVIEDPACGSGNAAVGAYLAATGALADVGASYTASQGTEIGRDGRVAVRVDDGGRVVEIGGCTITVVDGTIAL